MRPDARKGGPEMNIVFRELKANFKSFLLWCIGIIAIVAGGMGKYAGFSSSAQSISSIIDKTPRALLALFGMSGIDMSTVNGFYALIFLYVMIASTVYSSMLGAGIISKEERDKTSEFIFTKPVSRVSIITSKIIAALVYTTLYNVVALVASFIVAAMVTPESLNGSGSGLARDILVLSAGMLFVQLIYLFIGTGMASLMKKPGAAAGSATGVMLVTYFIAMVIDMTEKLDFLKYLTPFKYFEPKMLINGGSFELVFIIISVLLIALFLSATYIFFPKRDLYI
jgi:ABC-2 type transport system permease protein